MAPRKQSKDIKNGKGAKSGRKGVQKGAKVSKAKGRQAKDPKEAIKWSKGQKLKGTSGAGRVVKGDMSQETGKKKGKQGQGVKASTSKGRRRIVMQGKGVNGKCSTSTNTVKVNNEIKTRSVTKNQTGKNVKTDKKPHIRRGAVKRKRSTQDDVKPKKRVKESHEEPIIELQEARELSPIERLSLEVLCKIIQFLPLRDALKLQCLSRTLREAVRLHLRICRSINFTEGEVCGYMSSKISDKIFGSLVHRCPDLMNIYGLHPSHLCKPHCKDHAKLTDCFTIKGMMLILKNCQKLKGIETSHVHLLEAILLKLPHIKILGLFKNRGGTFPAPPTQSFCLRQNPPITKLNLTGVILPELPRMDYVIYLALKWVKFTNLNPFREFMAPRLHTFVMNNCSGPTNALKYVPLVTRLAAASNLTRLELVRVPFLGAFFQHVVEDTWRLGGFRQLKKILISACKHATEIDMGHLLLTAAESISEVYIQPSLTKDSLFLALSMAEPDFPKIDTISLGYVDPFPVEKGKWEPLQLALAGLADAGSSEHAALITDVGIQHVGKDFSFVKNLNAYNCPHLINPRDWLSPDGMCFAQLRSLHLNRCHAIKLQSFCDMLAELPAIETVYLERMFREPPKGCSRVGLSAGTGLGVSSAFVANQEPAPAAAAAAAPPAPEGNAAPAPQEGPMNQGNSAEGGNPVNDDGNPAQKANLRGAGNSEKSGSVSKASGPSGASSVKSGTGVGKSCMNCGKFYPDYDKSGSDHNKSDLDGSISDVNDSVNTGAETGSKDGKGAESGASATTIGTPLNKESDQVDKRENDENVAAKLQHPDGIEAAVVDVKQSVGQADESNKDKNVELSENHLCDQKVPDDVGSTCVKSGVVDDDKDAATDDTSSYPGKGKRPVGRKAFFKKRAKSSVVPGTSCVADGKDIGNGNRGQENGNELDGNRSHPVCSNGEGSRMVGENIASAADKSPTPIKSVTGGEKEGTDSHDMECNIQEPGVGIYVTENGKGSPNKESDAGSVDQVDCVGCGSGANSHRNEDKEAAHKEPQDQDTTTNGVTGHRQQDVEPGTQDISWIPGGSEGPGEAGCTGGTDNTNSVSLPSKDDKDSAVDSQEVWDVILQNSAKRTVGSATQATLMTPMDVDDDLPVVRPYEMQSSKKEPTGLSCGKQESGEMGKVSHDTQKSCSSSSDMPFSTPKTALPGSATETCASSGSGVPPSVASSPKDNNLLADDPSMSPEMLKMASDNTTAKNEKTGSKAEKSGSKNETVGSKIESSKCPVVHEHFLEPPASPEPVEARKTVGTQTTYNDAGDLHAGPSAEYAPPGEPGPPVQGAAESPPRRRDIPVFRCLSDVDDEELEEDAPQVLTVKSRTLVSLTLHMVGITDLVIVDSPQVKVLHGTACRVLKNVRLNNTPKLIRVTFAQCSKLNHMSVIRDVTRLPATSDRFVFLRPMSKFDPKCIGEELFRVSNGYHGCLIQDHSLDPGTTQIQKARFIEKIKLISSISFHILRLDKYPVFKKTPSSEPPWGRNLHNLTGTSPDDSPWEAMTDIPWLPHLENLNTKEEDKDAVDIIEEKLGLHKLYTMEHIWPFGCFEGLAEAIGHAEAAESALFPRTIGVYINTCDVSGIPTPDDYV
ncbi:F-box only protein 38-like [Lineus longissimus]|uniref:F-box only protein 38-like n=1 Tax=Lineus longissimus TaxID=88925 RepID=UPI002B4E8AF4